MPPLPHSSVSILTDLPTSRGGIRGVVELEVLRYLEKYLGGEIPIQAFFDLIVGTRFVQNRYSITVLFAYDS